MCDRPPQRARAFAAVWPLMQAVLSDGLDEACRRRQREEADRQRERRLALWHEQGRLRLEC